MLNVLPLVNSTIRESDITSAGTSTIPLWWQFIRLRTSREAHMLQPHPSLRHECTTDSVFFTISMTYQYRKSEIQRLYSGRRSNSLERWDFLENKTPPVLTSSCAIGTNISAVVMDRGVQSNQSSGYTGALRVAMKTTACSAPVQHGLQLDNNSAK